jgi:hypothetical protein
VIKREEALDLFRKWRSESSPLFCFADLFETRLILEGTVKEFTERQVSIASLDLKSWLLLALTSDLDFEYREPKDLPMPAPKTTVAIMVASLPLRVTLPVPSTSPGRQMIFFTELERFTDMG